MYFGEDALFRIRLLWGDLHGTRVQFAFDMPLRVRAACDNVEGILATDSNGGYDAIENNESPNLGLSCARAAVQAFSLK